jgi:hypothetical protein
MQRDPRQAIERRRLARARVKIVNVPESQAAADGAVTSNQVAEVTLPRSELDRVWSAEYLERLARTYWRFLTRVSLGILRIAYSETERAIVVLRRPFALITFHAPDYDTAADRGTVTWRIKRGFLVAPRGRGKGFLRISVQRPASDDGGDEITATVSSEVANFYPMIAGSGWFSRFGRWLYRVTQLRIHVIVTHAFLRSLARLDLAESRVGRYSQAELEQPAEDERATAAR